MEIMSMSQMETGLHGLETKMQAASMNNAKTRKLGLTDLPASVRNNIYKYALDTELVNVGESNVSYTHTLKDGVLQFNASRSPFLVQTNLFYVNKQISKEAQDYFYSKNLFVRFEIHSADARHAKSMLEDSGLLFSTASPEMLENSTQHALELVLVEKNSSQKRAAVMFPAQYLPRLINFLDQASRATASWAPFHSIFLNVVNTYDFPISRLQGDLLELFRLLSNLGAAAVDPKNLLPRYAEGLASDMSAASFEPSEWLAGVTSLADEADAAQDKFDYVLANEYSQTVIIALTYGYLTRAETLHSQPEAFSKSVQRLRWRAEMGAGIALSLIHKSKDWMDGGGAGRDVGQVARDFLLAEQNCSKALSLATNAPSPASNPWFLSLPVELIPPNKNTWFSDLERAQAWYALGTVHAALGEHLFAAGDMERAIELWGNEAGKEKVEKAFEAIREKIDGERESMFEGKIQPGAGLKRAARMARGVE